MLLQAFCAVAEVPRQEDFGLMDAVATLLRRDGRFLHAEDSFIVQIKSRSEKKIEYLGARFDALLSQDLSVMVAQVDSKKSTIELHTLGVALLHPNINDAKGLIVHLQREQPEVCGFVDDVLHVWLHKRILHWSIGKIDDRTYTDSAYAVLKAWLTIERWNRRYRRVGLFRQIRWEPNIAPVEDGEISMSSSASARDALSELAPTIRLLAIHGMKHPELRAPARTVISWMRKQGVEADPAGIHGTLLQNCDTQDRLQRTLEANPEAEIALTIFVSEARTDFLAFWLFMRNRQNNGSGRRYAGSMRELSEQGFSSHLEIVDDRANVFIDLSHAWLQEHHLDLGSLTTVADRTPQEGEMQILLLRKVGKDSVQRTNMH